eukprot:2602950-Pyramimonas_sp.AAC.1
MAPMPPSTAGLASAARNDAMQGRAQATEVMRTRCRLLLRKIDPPSMCATNGCSTNGCAA